GPQASNDFAVPRQGSGTQMDELFTELNIPREFTWAEWRKDLDPLRIPRDNYSHMDGINDTQMDVAYYLDGKWSRNIFADNLQSASLPEALKAYLPKSRSTP